MLFPMMKDFFFLMGFALFLCSLIVGVLLIVKPSTIVRLNKKTQKGFSFRRVVKFLDMPHEIDALFYRYHRVIGTIVTLVSAYVLYYFTLVYDAVLIKEYFSGSSYGGVVDLLINALRVFMLFSSAFILLIGIAIFIRPSLLKSVESWANRWISTRQVSEPLSENNDRLNQLAYKYPRLIGFIFVILSLYATILLFLFYTR